VLLNACTPSILKRVYFQLFWRVKLFKVWPCLYKNAPTFMPPNYYHWIHDEIYFHHIAFSFDKYCYIFVKIWSKSKTDPGRWSWHILKKRRANRCRRHNFIVNVSCLYWQMNANRGYQHRKTYGYNTVSLSAFAPVGATGHLVLSEPHLNFPKFFP
jgi:hypothetical protein